MKLKRTATAFAVLAAALYALNVPFSKLLLTYSGPSMMAAFLYLGAGLGLLICSSVSGLLGKKLIAEPLTKKELPYTAAMVVLDIAAPILLMFGIVRTDSANVSLLNNFEIVVTSLVAFFIFREVLSRRLCIAIFLVTTASVLLSFEGQRSLAFNEGSLFVIGACICWGVENNCTRKISSKSSVEIVIIKGFGSGMGSLIVAFAAGERLPEVKWLALILLLGFVAYGLSIDFYILAQKNLGAAKTGAWYSVAPFLGVFFSMVLLGERPGLRFWLALAVMAAAALLLIRDTVTLQHSHAHTHVHTHEHRHGDLVHTHEHSHTHTHMHIHGEDESQHTHRHGALPDDHCHTHQGF